MAIQLDSSCHSLIFPDPPFPAGAEPGTVEFLDYGEPFMTVPVVGEVGIEPNDKLMLGFGVHIPGQIESLMAAPGLDMIVRIDVPSGGLSAGDLVAIGRSRVSDLRLGKRRVTSTPPGFVELEFTDGPNLSALRGLSRFEVRGIPFSEENLATLGSPTLRGLRLADMTMDLSGLARFEWLWNLGIQGEGFGGDLSFLKCVPTIGGLDVRFSGLATSELSHRDQCPNLGVLGLGYNSEIGPDLSILCSGPRVTYLDISTTGADDTTLASIDRLVWLEQLHAQCTAITDDGLAALKSLLRVRHLNLAGTDITDDGLEIIVEAMPKLTSLDVGGTRITTDGAEQLLPRLKSVRTIGLSGDVTSVKFAERIRAETTLEQIDAYPPGVDTEVFLEALDIIGAARFKGTPV